MISVFFIPKNVPVESQVAKWQNWFWNYTSVGIPALFISRMYRDHPYISGLLMQKQLCEEQFGRYSLCFLSGTQGAAWRQALPPRRKTRAISVQPLRPWPGAGGGADLRSPSEGPILGNGAVKRYTRASLPSWLSQPGSGPEAGAFVRQSWSV